MAALGIKDLMASTKYLRSDGPHILSYKLKETIYYKKYI